MLPLAFCHRFKRLNWVMLSRLRVSRYDQRCRVGDQLVEIDDGGVGFASLLFPVSPSPAKTACTHQMCSICSTTLSERVFLEQMMGWEVLFLVDVRY